MGRLGLEPRTTGLTCRTGFHRPPALTPALRSGPSLHPRPGPGGWAASPRWALSRLAAGLPADRPIPGDFHHDGYSGALRGSQQIAADVLAISRLALLVEVPCSAS